MTPGVLPSPGSRYQLVLDAARTEAAAAREDGRLTDTVAGADPARVRDAVARFPLTVRCVP